MTAFIGRRDFITLLGGAAAAWPLAARAQQPCDAGGWGPARRVGGGMVGLHCRTAQRPERCGAGRGPKRAPSSFVGLTASSIGCPDLRPISSTARSRSSSPAAASSPSVLRWRQPEPSPSFSRPLSIPLSPAWWRACNRPGGNTTGITTSHTELEPKRLELLHELIPTAAKLALLVNSAIRGSRKPSLRTCKPRLGASHWRSSFSAQVRSTRSRRQWRTPSTSGPSLSSSVATRTC